jgi:hypothetical protein
MTMPEMLADFALSTTCKLEEAEAKLALVEQVIIASDDKEQAISADSYARASRHLHEVRKQYPPLPAPPETGGKL